MLGANHAVRLGLRAASRNPELAFAKALLDQGGSLLSMLPIALVAAVVIGGSGGNLLALALRAIGALSNAGWALAGAGLAASALAWVAGAAFWSGALPLLAADAEMDRRPPPGNFALLVGRGFGRVLVTSLLSGALGLLASLSLLAAIVVGLPAMALARGPGVAAGLALVIATSIALGVLLDLLARLMLVRAAAFGDGATQAFSRAAGLLGGRLGTLFGITLGFLILEIVVATAMAMFSGMVSTGFDFDPEVELLALAPRIAVGLAFAAVFAWIEVARTGALAALAADAEGLLGDSEPVVEAVPVAELVVEALPVPEEPAT